MEFSAEKFERDEYAFRIRTLLESDPEGVNLSILAEKVRATPGPDGKPPSVSDATLQVRIERALLGLAIFEGVTFTDGPEGVKVVRRRRLMAMSRPPGALSRSDPGLYHDQIIASLNAAPGRKLASKALRDSVRKSIEAEPGQQFDGLLYESELIKMENDQEILHPDDNYQLPA